MERISLISCCGVVIFATVMVCEISDAAPDPTSQNVRSAIERSLPYIEKVGTAWMQERKCNSCHNVTFLVWTYNEAAARGFEINRTKLAQWTKWSLADALSDRFWFKLRPRAMASLKVDGFPQALLTRLKPLEGKTYLTQQAYLHALEDALGVENLAANKERLLKAGSLPNNGGGPDTLSQLLLGQAASGQDESVKESYKRSYGAIRSLLLQWQEPDGSWEAQGQLPSLKWAGPTEMHEATTMWSLLAVSAGSRGDSSNDQAVFRSTERALESLKKVTPESTLQTLALHLVIAQKFGGERARTQALLKELVSLQHADGGWGWVRQDKISDTFATGQALYALGLCGHDAQDPVVSRAWGFLLQTQEKDGSWQVPQEAINTRHRGLNVYTFWGTAWAAIGMLHTLPAADHPP